MVNLNTVPPRNNRDYYLAIGLEGSANKLGVGIIKHPRLKSQEDGDLSHQCDLEILSNIRDTYVTPAGEGFLPRDTARHHRNWVVRIIRKALDEAGIQDPTELDVICFTKGPGMGAPLHSVVIAARTISLMWDVPMVGVNHCVGHIEMGREITKAENPVVLYVCLLYTSRCV